MGAAGLRSPFGPSLETRSGFPSLWGPVGALLAGRLTHPLQPPCSHKPLPLRHRPPSSHRICLHQTFLQSRRPLSAPAALPQTVRLREFLFLIIVSGPGSRFLPEVS